jgi:hypothetical protein
VADGGPPRLEVRFDYHFDRLLSAKLAQVYGLLVPDHRWPVQPAGTRLEESAHEHAGGDLRARVVRSSA